MEENLRRLEQALRFEESKIVVLSLSPSLIPNLFQYYLQDYPKIVSTLPQRFSQDYPQPQPSPRLSPAPAQPKIIPVQPSPSRTLSPPWPILASCWHHLAPPPPKWEHQGLLGFKEIARAQRARNMRERSERNVSSTHINGEGPGGPKCKPPPPLATQR